MDILLLIIGIAAVAGQCGDAWSTYYGVFVKKCAVEGSLSPVTQWLAKSKWRLLVLKPAAAVLVASLVNLYLVQVPWLALFGAIMCAALAYSGTQAFVHNWKINTAK